MLTAKTIKTLTKQRTLDAHGLYFCVSPSGARKWTYRYRHQRRSREMGLGGYPEVSLQQARIKRDVQRALRNEGLDPLEEKQRQARQKLAAGEQTFARAAAFAYDVKREELTNPKYAKQWMALLQNHAIPALGARPVSELTVNDVYRVLRPLWNTKLETARKLRQNIRYVIDWAKAGGWCPGDNPASPKGPLDFLLPNPARLRVVRPHAALAYQALPSFMAELVTIETNAALALRFLILTASRTSEVLGMERDEISFEERLWQVPATRMKTRTAHRVPLSPPALSIVSAIWRTHNQRFVFRGQKPDQALSNMSMLSLMNKRFPKLRARPHGFRSTFKVWASEMHDFDPLAVEFCLAHKLRDRVEAAYLRTDLLEKRRHIMEK